MPADVLVSRDAGATWSELAPGLPGATIWQLAFGPPGTLYAGTQGASVYVLALDPAPPGTGHPFYRLIAIWARSQPARLVVNRCLVGFEAGVTVTAS